MIGSNGLGSALRWILFAEQVNPPQPTLIGAAVFIVVTAIAVGLLWKHWQEAHEEFAPDAPEDLLASFEEAHAAGEIDDEEFEKLRKQLRE